MGMCNGVRALVVHALPKVLDVLLVSGTKAGTRVFIPRFALAPKNPDLPFVLRRRQFPVKLAWAMTLNKAQGQTLQQVGLYLSRSVFSHGQLYVGLSRAGASHRVKVLVVDDENQGYREAAEDVLEGVYTDNVVWKEVLLQGCAGAELSGQDVAPQPRAMSDSAAMVPDVTSMVPNATECFDEESGAPGTPRVPHPPQQPFDRHGADDLDEYGAAPSHDAEGNIVFSADVHAPDGLEPNSAAGCSAHSTDSGDQEALLQELREHAQSLGIGQSEWYFLKQKPVEEILTLFETEQASRTPGASSSST